jgi:hypothetical protein
MFVLLAAGTGGAFLVLRLLPKRRIRTAGSRSSRIPYTGIGYAVVIFSVVMLIISLVFQTLNVTTVIGAVTSGILFSRMMSYLARRVKTPTVEETLSKDQRPPLLYLRSFDQELQRFAEVSHEDAAKYSEITSYHASSNYHLTLEQFLAREFKNTIGPLIALGNPTDSLPPEGAARTYAADGGWQEYFIDLSNRSAAILMQMGNTDNLNWELGSIRGRGLQTKMFVVTPPASNVGKFWIMGRLIRLSNRIKGIQPASWDRFAAILEKAGYIPPAEDPGPGAIVTFDEDKRAVILISGAKTPAEYVGAISRHVGNHAEEINPLEAER